MTTIMQLVQSYWQYLAIGGTAAGVIGLINHNLIANWFRKQETPKILNGVFRAEVVNDMPDETEVLRDALKTLTCHVALNVDDLTEQTAALNACRVLKKTIPVPPSIRPQQAIENQEAVLAAVQAYNATDKITAVG